MLTRRSRHWSKETLASQADAMISGIHNALPLDQRDEVLPASSRFRRILIASSPLFTPTLCTPPAAFIQ